MLACGDCGAEDQTGRYCVRCGAEMHVPDTGISALPEATVLRGSLPGATANAAPAIDLHKRGTSPPGIDLRKHSAAPEIGPTPDIGPARPTLSSNPVLLPEQPQRRRGLLVAILVGAVVASLAVAAAVIVPRMGDGTAGQAQTAPTAAAQAPSARTSESAPVRSAVIATVTQTRTATVTPPPAPPTTTSAPAPLDPMGGPRADIPCGSGYIVQIASELTAPVFEGRVATIRAAGTIPPGSKWTDTNSSCSIFSSQVNVFVLYAGPFTSAYDACPARLASPADAFIKGTTADTSHQYVSCLCVATATQLPNFTTIGQTGVWVGELQRVLGGKLDYSVGAIDADPSVGDPGRWGTYTAETAAAVGRFQRDHSLSATQQTDAGTWAALQQNSC